MTDTSPKKTFEELMDGIHIVYSEEAFASLKSQHQATYAGSDQITITRLTGEAGKIQEHFNCTSTVCCPMTGSSYMEAALLVMADKARKHGAEILRVVQNVPTHGNHITFFVAVEFWKNGAKTTT